MAKLIEPKTKNSISKLGIAAVRQHYYELADTYTKIINGTYLRCPICGEFKINRSYYEDGRFDAGVFPICKECLYVMATDYDKTTKEYIDNKEKAIKVFQLLDIPFIESLWISSEEKKELNQTERRISSSFKQVLIQVKSLPNYHYKHFKDSEFISNIEDIEDDEVDSVTISKTLLKRAQKRFGLGFTDEDYYFLETEYEDWTTRYECSTKAQEEIFQRLCFKKLEIHKAQLKGEQTNQLDKSYQDLLGTANITPKQYSSADSSDSPSLGVRIQKYEETRPIPDPDPEFQDVDKIGLYIDAFYKGHAAKEFGLKNRFTDIYEKVMKKFTVTPPQYDEDEDSEYIFSKIFGSQSEN